MEVDDSWEYNCPQFVDFTQPIADDRDHNIEDYFNYDHENDSLSENTSMPTAFQQSNMDEILPSTPKGKTPTKANNPLMRSALKDTNSLTPRRSIRIQNATTPKGNTEGHGVDKENNCQSPKKLSQQENDKPQQKCVIPEPKEGTPLSKKRSSSQADKNIVNGEPPLAKRVRRSIPIANTVVRKPSLTVENIPKIVPARERTKSATLQNRRLSTHRRSLSAAPRSHTRTSSNTANLKKCDNTQIPKPAAREPSVTRGKSAHTRTASVDQSRSNTAGHVRTQSVDRGRSTTLKRTNSLHTRTTSGAVASKERMMKQLQVKHKPTVPITPAVLRREQSKEAGDRAKNWEEREIDTINKLKHELADKRRLADQSLKKALSGSRHAPMKSKVEATRPEGFNFATDTRIKPDAQRLRKGSESHKDFTATLRQHTGSPPRANTSTQSEPGHAQKKLGVTIPEPFSFAGEKKRKRTLDEQVMGSNKFKSMAEQMKTFSSRTPDRFHTKPANSKELRPKRPRSETSEHKVTIPKTPNFQTKTRSRPVLVPSHSQLEDEEVEEMKKYRFRANPVNDKALKNPMVPRIVSKEPTVPEGFDLESDRRIRDRHTHKTEDSEEEEHYEFHANPIPKHILEGTVGIKAPKMIPLTKPASPAFALKQRMRAYKQQEAVERVLKPMPKLQKSINHTGIPFQPKLEHKSTEFKPFSFESRHHQMKQHKEQLIQRALDEEKKMREFKASLLPDQTAPAGLPPKRTRQNTAIKPFNLEVDQRGSYKAEEWARKVEDELKQQRAGAAFKAKSAAAVHKQPFQPRKSEKRATEVAEFELSTSHRNERWAELERYKHERQIEEQAAQHAQELRRKEEQEAEVQRQREDAVHRAKPIRQYRSVEVKSSDRPLTQPMTPRFSDRLKSRAK